MEARRPAVLQINPGKEFFGPNSMVVEEGLCDWNSCDRCKTGEEHSFAKCVGAEGSGFNC